MNALTHTHAHGQSNTHRNKRLYLDVFESCVYWWPYPEWSSWECSECPPGTCWTLDSARCCQTSNQLKTHTYTHIYTRTHTARHVACCWRQAYKLQFNKEALPIILNAAGKQANAPKPSNDLDLDPYSVPPNNQASGWKYHDFLTQVCLFLTEVCLRHTICPWYKSVYMTQSVHDTSLSTWHNLSMIQVCLHDTICPWYKSVSVTQSLHKSVSVTQSVHNISLSLWHSPSII